jgi:hypothetical protein
MNCARLGGDAQAGKSASSNEAWKLLSQIRVKDKRQVRAMLTTNSPFGFYICLYDMRAWQFPAFPSCTNTRGFAWVLVVLSKPPVDVVDLLVLGFDSYENSSPPIREIHRTRSLI